MDKRTEQLADELQELLKKHGYTKFNCSIYPGVQLGINEYLLDVINAVKAFARDSKSGKIKPDNDTRL